MVYTNALYAQQKKREAQGCGPARRAGQSSISAASRNGPPMKDPLWPSNRRSQAISHGLGSGDVPVAISPKTCCLQHTHAGARKRLILGPYLAYRRTHADKLVGNRELYLRNALIPAIFFAMPGHVLLANMQDRPRAVSVVRNLHLEDVSIPIISPDGAVVRFVGTLCHVESILVPGHVTKVYVVPAKYLWTAVVTAAMICSRSYAVSGATRSKAKGRM